MKIIACYKIVPDAQDIDSMPDGSLNLERAERVIGEYDLVALEEAARLAEASGGSAVLLSAGGKELTDSKLVKSALSRGAEELYCVIDDAMGCADAFQVASVLARALEKIGAYDLVICGEGSSDLYAQQVGTLVGTLAGVTVLNAVSRIEITDEGLVVERTLENEIEIVKVKLPALISVTSATNVPRIPQLKDILAAGKKPVTVWSSTDVEDIPPCNIEELSTVALRSVERKHMIYEGVSDENITEFLLALKAAK